MLPVRKGKSWARRGGAVDVLGKKEELHVKLNDPT